MTSSPVMALYAQRLGTPIHIGANADVLRHLHSKHQQMIPFENLWIRKGVDLSLSQEDLIEKLLLNNNGGFCYELNLLFRDLLAQMHFRTRLISGRVFSKKGLIGPAYDHMAMCVDLKGKKYLVDVGFGGFSATPVPMVLNAIHQDQGQFYRVRNWDEQFKVVEKSRDGIHFSPLYLFDCVPRTVEEFQPMFQFHQRSELSLFTQKTIVSKITSEGRITLTDSSLIITDARGKRIIRMDDTSTFSTLLGLHFGITLPQKQQIA